MVINSIKIKKRKKLILICLLFFMLFLGKFSLKSEDENFKKSDLLQKIRQYRKNHELKIIREFFNLLSIPNVSSDKMNIRRNARFIKELMTKYGVDSRIIETSGNPVVFGELKAEGATKTLMFYVHYDGQPVKPSKWTDSHPFEPIIRPGKLKPGSNYPKLIPFPMDGDHFNDDWHIYARSTSDDKAPIICLMTALEAIRDSGYSFKNNLKFIFEGEEEAGSPNLEQFLKKNKNILDSDVLFLCDGPVYFTEDPTLFFGVRGIISVKITVYGPNRDLHSGHYGNWAPNPAMLLSKLLATFKDEKGQVMIEGFYDNIAHLNPVEKKALRKIPAFDKHLKELYEFCNSDRIGLSLMEAIQYPSLNINGIQSGGIGSQIRTIIPSYATASIDIRLVKGNEQYHIYNKLVNHIKDHGYHVISKKPNRKERLKYPLLAKVVLHETGYKAYRASMNKPIVKSVINTLKDHYHDSLILIPSLGGSLPIYIFNDILKVPCIGVPIANYDNNQHMQDENIRIGHLWGGIETFSALIMMDNVHNK